MAPRKPKEEITVVAELSITDGAGETLIVRSFDTAWHLMLICPMPASSHFIRFVRKD